MPEPTGLVGMAGLVVAARRGLTFGDLRPHDLLGFSLGKTVPLRFPGAQTGHGPGEMRALGTGCRRGRNG